MSTHQPPDASNPGYERRDVRIGALIWLGLTVFLGTTAVFVVLWFLLGFLERQAQRADPELSPLAAQQKSPAGPALQETPIEDLQRLIERDEAILSSYGWVDKEQRSVRIPISKAMDITLARGLPRPAPQREAGEQPKSDFPMPDEKGQP